MSQPLWIKRAMSATHVFYEIVLEKLGEEAQEYLHFPRNIEALILYSLEIPVKPISELTLHAAAEYLCILGSQPSQEPTEDRPLWGLLNVGPPANMILIEERLSPLQRRYTIAHELGHYLYDIFTIRQLWLRSLSEQKEAVIQAFSWHEMDLWLELCAMLKRLPQRPRTITGRGQAMLQETKMREQVANAIALELLAPWEKMTIIFPQLSRSEMLSLLSVQFGIPAHIASAYYDDLHHALKPAPDLFDRLFAPLLQNKQMTDQPEKP